MEGQDTIKIITVAGVIITAIISLINIYISYYGNRKTAYINTITSERIRWMTSLKEMLSEFCSLVYKQSDESRTENYGDQIVKLQLKIKLYLNPLDDKPIIDQLDICVDEILNTNNCRKENLDKLVCISQKMLKNEWKRIKNESQNGNREANIVGFWPKGKKQWFKLLISLVGILFGLYYYNMKTIDFNDFAGIVTVLAFGAYLVEGLLTNIEEREKMNNNADNGSI